MDKKEEKAGVKITPPDHSLQIKLGGMKLEQLLSPHAMQKAQNAINGAAQAFFIEAMGAGGELEKANKDLQGTEGDKKAQLKLVADIAFSLKTKTAMCGYDLVAALAKSLHLMAERKKDDALTPKDLEIIDWHVSSAMLLMRGHLHGMGGPLGDEIMKQLEKMAPPKEAKMLE